MKTEAQAVVGCVYLIRNKVNGKGYVGQHKNALTVERRWRAHINEALLGACSYLLHRAIRKNGVESFSAEIIWCGPVDQLNEKESHYIKKLHTFVDDSKGGGYNLTTGGEVCKQMAKSARKKLSASRKLYFENTPGAREENAARVRQYYKDNPEECKRARAQIVAYFSDPAARKAQSKRAKRQWASDAARASMSALKLSQYENEELRKKISVSGKKRFTVPGACEAARAVSLSYNTAHPEKGAKHSAFMKERAKADPSTYAVQIEAMRKYWAKRRAEKQAA